MVTTQQLAAAVLEELREVSPQSRERLFEALCTRYPSQISKADVKTALQLLERRKEVAQVSGDVWSVSRPGQGFGKPMAPVPVLVAGEAPVQFGRSSVRSPVAAPPLAPREARDGGTMTGFVWSSEQKAVIEAPKVDWVLVEAGPGTGKTAVACARVAHLLDQGVPGHAIIMVSFTRTAVTELRARIRTLARESRGAASVRITTLDSEAWHLGVGFGTMTAKDRLEAGYSANIRDAVKLLKKEDPALMEWLEGTQHLIIDEGQDLVGDRAELVFSLLNLLPEHTGVTVFVDPAQAIYGFSSDADDEQEERGEEAFHEQLRREFASFRELRLTKLFRTGSRPLEDVFQSGRVLAMGTTQAHDRLKDLHALVARNCEKKPHPDEDPPSADELVLFRRRSEVLLASSFLSKEGVAHRLRLSQVELGIQPWVGAVLMHARSARLSQTEFLAIWTSLGPLQVLSGHSAVECWALCLRTARAANSYDVDVRALKRILSRGRPPPEFSLTEAGLKGPILGTVHASKGRESAKVRLMLPSRGKNHRGLEEEIRVDYVGATRAKQEMTVGKGYTAYGYSGLRAPGDRIQAIKNPKERAAFVEIGRPGDLDELSPVSRGVQPSSVAASGLQQKLLAYDGSVVELRGLQVERPPWTYLLFEGEGKTVWGAFSQRVNQDFLALCQKFPDGERLRPPDQVHHLHVVGVRTVVVDAEDASRLAALHEPWATTGVFLAPVVKALTKVLFKWRSRRQGAAR